MGFLKGLAKWPRKHLGFLIFVAYDRGLGLPTLARSDKPL